MKHPKRHAKRAASAMWIVLAKCLALGTKGRRR